jgi:hypothetical protein
MAYKKYAYYNKGNKIGLIEAETASDNEPLEFERYVSPKETITDGLQLEYTYSPSYRVWGDQYETSMWPAGGYVSNGGYLQIVAGAGGFVPPDENMDFSELNAGDWIEISGSTRWNGLHQIRSNATTSSFLTNTKFDQKMNSIQLYVTFTAATNAVGSYGLVVADGLEFRAFCTHLAASFDQEFGKQCIYITGASAAENNGLFTLAEAPVLTLKLDKKLWFGPTDLGEGVEYDADIQTASSDELVLFQAHRDSMIVRKATVMEDESFDLDISDYQAQAVVYYLKAKLAEDMRDMEGREYFLRLFRKQMEKSSSARKKGPYRVQGFWGMRK